MSVSASAAVEVVLSISTGSALAAEHPETLVLYVLGQRHLEYIRVKLSRSGVPDTDDRWRTYDALHEEMTAVYPMVLETCTDELAARRCEWYAKVLRATTEVLR